ncbi:MAG: sigma-70 family RNA polymerase sigma factor [Verrucomicrobiales bacterium]|nr:sigma-70 family RNA polymerase sigma factor [Verrucomicrobiales bacterium]
MSEVTRLLDAVERGESQAAEELLPLVYEELRQLAAARMANEKPGQTLQPTALVHEAWLRLLGPDHAPQSWEGRGHFFGAAAEAMRRILVDSARRKQRLKRGEGQHRIDLDSVPELAIQGEDDDAALLLVDEALERLAARDPQKAEVVKLRYFAGLNHSEVARALNLSEKTVQRYWQFAKAWLCEDIERHKNQPS